MKNLSALLLCGVMFALSSCGDNDNNNPAGGNDGYGYDFTATIATYIDDVVIPTYTLMKNDVKALHDAVVAYDNDPSPDKLVAVCDAWRAARIPWEQSEGFLFGPAALLGLDPSLDSWPLDKGSIDRIISGSEEINPERITADNLHGFHAIEYLIFDGGNPKTSTLGEREQAYLLAAAEILRTDTYLLWANWIGADNIDDDDVSTVFEEEEIEVQYNFTAHFKHAGTAGSLFASQDEAIDQIVEGCITIADEVGAQKIGGPNGQAKEGNLEAAVLEVESWYSWNSIDDYANNIISIRNSYFGGNGLTATTASLSAFVKSKDTALDTEITDAIEAAYDAIYVQMDKPFRNNLTGEKVDAAMDACADLVDIFEKIKSLKD